MAARQWNLVKANGLPISAARLDVQRLRAQSDAIVTGIWLGVGRQPKHDGSH